MGLGDFLSVPNVSLPDDSGIQQALARNTALGQQHHQDGGLFGGGLKVGSPLRNFIGAVADALSVAGGGQPLYQKRLQEKRSQSAVSQYLGNIDPELAGLLGNGLDSETALGLYKIRHPASETPSIVAELKAAGIDPASDEGKAIIRQHAVGSSGGADPSIIRVLGALGIDPHSDEGRRLVYGSVSPPGYLMTPPAGGATSGGSEGLPHVSTPEEAHQLPPGSRFLMPDGRIGTVPGGPTAAAPSGGFPVNKVLDALTAQESHGDGTAIGPSTKYGRAYGSTQLQQGTAKEMATKLGLSFRPDMLHSNDPAALRYQRALAEAYLREGLDKTGNLTDALHYYHGGPDRSLWGPKTRAYADSVLARLQ